MKRIQIIIVDDHPVFREGLFKILNDEKDFDVLCSTSSAKETITKLDELHPDLMTIDISLPDMNGIQLLKYVMEKYPKIKVLILSAHNVPYYIKAALRAGASGYLLKESNIKELINAVRSVYAGNTIFDSGLILGRANQQNAGLTNTKNHFCRLNNRELEVLQAVAQGMSNKDIARYMTISERTVQTHLSHIYQKLNVESRTEALIKSIELKLIMQ